MCHGCWDKFDGCSSDFDTEDARKVLVDIVTAAHARGREEGLEEAAKHLEREADLATGSLHCGDNAMTISNTSRWVKTVRAAAASIRSRLTQKEV